MLYGVCIIIAVQSINGKVHNIFVRFIKYIDQRNMLQKKLIDQNYLREPNEKLHHYLSKGNFVIFSDFTRMECAKGKSIINLKRSLEIVSKYTYQVLMLKDTKTIVFSTYKALKNIRNFIIDKQQSADFQNFCTQVHEANGKPSFVTAYLEKMGSQANSYIKERYKYTQMILDSINPIKDSFNSTELKQIRNNQPYSKDLLKKIIKNIMIVTAMLMSSNNIKNKEFRIIINSYLFRYSAASFFLTLKWISDGGIEQIDMDNFQNDIIDLSYSVYGTYFDGVLSNDNKLMEIYTKLDFFLKHLL